MSDMRIHLQHSTEFVVLSIHKAGLSIILHTKCKKTKKKQGRSRMYPLPVLHFSWSPSCAQLPYEKIKCTINKEHNEIRRD